MGEAEIIEGEFRVIGSGEAAPVPSYAEPPADASWSFWLDDLPALASIAGGFLTMFALKLLFF